jgi:hypothetical protein
MRILAFRGHWAENARGGLLCQFLQRVENALPESLAAHGPALIRLLHDLHLSGHRAHIVWWL